VSRENPDRYALAARVQDLLAPELAAEGWDLLDVRIFRGGGRLQVRLYVDLPGEARIDLDGCARASRAASMFLEEADLFGGAWVLEVSSPGIRRPLRSAAHFAAVVGRDIDLKWRPLDAPTSRPQNLRGRLESVADGVLVVQPPVAADARDDAPAAVEVPVAAVLEANLDHDFDAQAVIRDDRRRRKQDKQNRRAARKGRGRVESPGASSTDNGDANDERDGS
jgi:ribosome maturation factor RimP